MKMKMKVKIKLCVSSFPLTVRHTLTRWFKKDALSHFPQLEKLETHMNFTVSTERIVEQIRPVVTRCPQLRSIVSSDSVCELVKWKVIPYDREGMFSIG